MKPPEQFIVTDKNFKEIMRFYSYENLNFDQVKSKIHKWMKENSKNTDQILILGIYDYIDWI